MAVILATGTNWDDPPSILIYIKTYTHISARVDQLLILKIWVIPSFNFSGNSPNGGIFSPTWVDDLKILETKVKQRYPFDGFFFDGKLFVGFFLCRKRNVPLARGIL